MIRRQMRIRGFQLQDQPGQALRERIMQLARHALAFGGNGQVFHPGSIFGQLAVGNLQVTQQSLGLHARFCLPAVQDHIHYHKERHRQHGQEPPVPFRPAHL